MHALAACVRSARVDDPSQNIRGRTIAFAALPARAQSLDDLYAKAKGEGAFGL